MHSRAPADVPVKTRVTRILADEGGAATAEFAIMIPAVLLVLGIAIGGIHLAAHRVAITSLAGELARLEARGDAARAAAQLARFTGAPEVERSTDGELHCVTVRSRLARGVLAAISVTAESCAAVTVTDGAGGA